MSLDIGGHVTAVYQGENDRALATFAAALKKVSRRSATVGQLLEAVNRASGVGETQLDSVRLNGLQASDEDVEVRSWC